MPRNHRHGSDRSARPARSTNASRCEHSRDWRQLRFESLEARELLASRLFGIMVDNPGLIREFNPATGAIVNSFPAPAVGAGQGLAFDGARLFYSVSDGNGSVWELNPATGAVLDLDTYATGSRNFGSLALLNGKLYVADNDSNQIFVVDPNTDSIIATLNIAADLSGGLTGVSQPDELIAQAGTQIVRIDPVTGELTNIFPAPAALEGIGFVGNELFFASPGIPSIGRFSRTGTFLGEVIVPVGLAALGSDAAIEASVPSSAPRLFAASSDTTEHLRQILELNPATGEVIHAIPAPLALGSVGSPLQVGLAYAGGNLFVLNGAGAKMLLELDPDTGAIVDQDQITGSENYDGLAIIGSIAYLQSHDADQIVVFDTVTDTVLATLSPGIDLLGGLAAAKNPPALLASTGTPGPGSVVELDPETGAVVNTFGLVGFPRFALGLAVLGEEIYVGSGEANVIQRFSRTGAMIGTITPPFPVNALGGDAFGRPDTPQVTPALAPEDGASGPLVIEKASAGNPAVSHFRISGIVGGTLFKSDGTTQVAEGSFITVAEGQAGLKFQPEPDRNLSGSFLAEASLDGVSISPESDQALGTIQIVPIADAPSVPNPTTGEDTLSDPIVIQRNAKDGLEVTHFRISNIQGGTLFKADGTTPISNGSLLASADALAGIRFLPTAESNAAGSFDVEASQDGVTGVPQSKVTSEVTVTAVNDPPHFVAVGGIWRINLDTGAVHIPGYITQQAAGPANESGQAVHFEVTIDSTSGNLAFTNPPVIILATGDLTYTPAHGTSGTASVSIRLVDDGPAGGANQNTSVAQVFAIDVPAQLPDLTLPGNSLVENQMGAVAGAVNVVGGPAGASYTWSLSDSRFEVLAGQLKLKADQYLATTDTIDLSAMAMDGSGRQYVKTLSVAVANNPHPWHNQALPEDADGNGTRNLEDALFLIRQLRRGLGGALPVPRSSGPGVHFGDVVADGTLDVRDAIGVIRYLRQAAHSGGEGESRELPAASAEAAVDDALAWDLAIAAIAEESRQKKRLGLLAEG
jgi:YVTN family beta-propeller protein